MSFLNYLRFIFLFIVLFLHLSQALGQCKPTITASNNGLLCKGGSVKLTSVEGTNYLWLHDGQEIPRATSIEYTATLPGKYKVKVKLSDPACADISDDFEVKEVDLPATPSFNFSPSALQCSGTPITFSVNFPDSELKYLWDFGDNKKGEGISIIHTFEAFGGGVQTFPVKLIAQNKNGCISEKTINIDINQQPEINLNNPKGFRNCNGGPFDLVVNDFSKASDNADFTIDWGDGSPIYSSKTQPIGIVHNYPSLGIYELKFTIKNANDCSSTKTYNVFNITNPAVSATSPGNTTGCTPLTITVPITNVSNNHPSTIYTVDFGDGSPIQTFNHPAPTEITHTYLKTSCGRPADGTFPADAFVFKITATNACGSTPAAFGGIRVYSKTESNFSFPPEVCVNTAVTFANSSIEGGNDDCSKNTTYTWNWGDGSPLTLSLSKDSKSHVYSTPGTYTISLKAENYCGSSIINKTINVISAPKVSASIDINPINECIKSTITTNNKSVGESISYQWSILTISGSAFNNYSIKTGSLTSRDFSFEINNPGSYKIRLIVTNQCGSDTKELPFIIKAPPTAQLPADQTYCGPQTLKFDASSTNHKVTYNSNGSTITSYSWTIDNVAASFEGGTTNSSQYPEIKFPSAGDYNVTVRATNECGISTVETQKISILPPPQILTIANSGPLCEGQTLNLSATASAGSTFSWIGPGGFTSFVQNPIITGTSTTKGGTYTLTVRVGICTTTATTTVVINKAPTIPNAGGDQNLCNANQAVLNGNIPSSGIGVWTLTQKPAGAADPVISNPGQHNPTVTNLEPGEYRFKWTISNDGCSSKEDEVIIINSAPPTPAKAGEDQEHCSPSKVTLDANTPEVGQGEWTRVSGPSNPFTNINKNNPKIEVTTLSSGTYVFRWSISSGACPISSDEVTIKINSLPNLAQAGLDQTLCGVSNYTLNGNVPSSGTGAWTQTEGDPITINQPSNPKSAISGLKEGSYKLKWTITNGNCPASSSEVNITVFPAPDNPVAGPDQEKCDAQEVQLAGNTITKGTGKWLRKDANGKTATIVDEKDPNTKVTGLQPGTYIFSWTNTSGTCPVKSDDVIITIYDTPTQANAGSDQEICNSFVKLQGNSPSAGTGTWTLKSGPNTPSIAGANQPTPTVTNLIPGEYIFTWSIASGNCTFTTSDVKVKVNALPTTANAGSKQVLCDATSATLKGNIPSIGKGKWVIVTAPADSKAKLSDDTAPAAILSDLSLGTYKLKWEITNGTCSPSRAEVEIINNPLLSNNEITFTPTPICEGDNPGLITASQPAGGDNTYQFAWQISTTGAENSYTNAPGVFTDKDYNGPKLNQDTWYRRLLISRACSHTSEAIKIKVNPPIQDNTISQNQTLCLGTLPKALTGSLPKGGDGNPQYTWEWKTGSKNFSPIPGATSQHFVPDQLTETTIFQRKVTMGGCTLASNIVTITIEQNISNNTISQDQVICQEQVPNLLTGSLPAGGDNNPQYIWEQSVEGAPFAAIAEAIGQDYQPGKLAKTTQFRRIVTAGICKRDTSATIQVTVNPALDNNILTTSKNEICENTDGGTITGSDPVGGDKNYLYSWKSKTVGAAGYTSIPGATLKDYSPGPLSQTTWFIREVSSGGCLIPSAPVEIKVIQPVTNNTIEAPAQAICAGTTAPVLKGSTHQGGVPGSTFKWQMSTTSATDGFEDAPAPNNSKDYIPGTVSRATWYRRIIIGGPCTADTSPAVVFNVNEPISNNNIEGTQQICAGENAAQITGSIHQGGNSNFTYRWESSTDGTNFTAAKGTNTQIHYSPGVLNTTTWFRRTISSDPCEPLSSNTIKIEVTPGITNNIVSSNSEICENTTAPILMGSNPLGGSGSFAYQWEISLDGTNFTTADRKSTDKDYTPGVLQQTTWFRRLVISGYCTNPSSPVKITVYQNIADNSISTDQDVCVGSTPDQLQGTEPIGGNGKYLYLWESSLDNITFVPATGVNHFIDYQPGALPQTTWFRRRVSAGPCAPSVSNPVRITVNPLITNNLISKPQRICKGTLVAPLTGTPPNGGNGIYTYVWEVSTAGVNGPYAIAPGQAREATYDPAYLGSSAWFRRTTFSGGCTNVSRPIQITVDEEITNNIIAVGQTICYNMAPALLTGTTPENGNGAYLYTWEVSIDGTTFMPAPGQNANLNYQPPALTQTTWIRRIVRSIPCQELASNVIEIKVLSLISANTITSSQQICYNTIPATLTGTSPAGGGGNYTFLWESSTTGPTSGFAPASGKNDSDSYTPPALKQTTWYRRTVISAPCNALTSAAIEIKVKQETPIPKANEVTICPGFTATLTAEGSAHSYQWFDASRDGNLLFTGQTFTTPILDTTTTYYVQGVVDGCAGTRFAVKANVYDFKADAGPDLLISRGETVRLQAKGGVKYQWYPGETLTDSTSAFPFATPKETTVYMVKVTSAEGCTGTDEVKVTIIPNIIVSNGITPNGDGYNDTWVIQNIEFYPEASIEIFNRWGNRIYHSKGYVQAWDGKYNGQDLPVAAYYYVIKLDNKKTPISGSITIAR